MLYGSMFSGIGTILITVSLAGIASMSAFKLRQKFMSILTEDLILVIRQSVRNTGGLRDSHLVGTNFGVYFKVRITT
jgi:hypothetical protein